MQGRTLMRSPRRVVHLHSISGVLRLAHPRVCPRPGRRRAHGHDVSMVTIRSRQAEPPPPFDRRPVSSFFNRPLRSSLLSLFGLSTASVRPWLTVEEERWVVVVCACLVVAMCATVAAGGAVWVGLQ